MIIKILKKPYQTETSIKKKLIQSLVFGIFVFLFLFIFQPFSIGLLKDSLLLIALCFGAITTVSMVLLNIIIPIFLKKFFLEENWNVGKELFYSLVNVWFIGLANFFYFNLIYQNQFLFHGVLWFQFVTLAIGILPITFVILLREKKLSTFYSNEANQIKPSIQKTEETQEIIVFQSSINEENIEISIYDLLYLKAADNYVEIYYYDTSIHKKIIRNTLKYYEDEFKNHENLYRCHKSYMVNLEKVERISGNAQGYKLHLTNCDDEIPVSRKLNDEIKTKFTR